MKRSVDWGALLRCKHGSGKAVSERYGNFVANVLNAFLELQALWAWHLWLATESGGPSARSLPLLREALKNQSDSNKMRWHLAASLANSGNKHDAIVELDRLLTSQANLPQGAQAQTLLMQLRDQK